MENKCKKLIEAIEELNKENIELKLSKEYRIGNTLIRNIAIIKELNFSQLMKNIKDQINKKKFAQYNNKINSSDLYQANTFNFDFDEYPRVAVYTCILGGYDKLSDPLYCEENFEYFLFTDQPDYKSEVWIKKEIPEHLQQSNNTMINRYIKLHPNEFFKDFDYAIYIDGNVRIISDVRNMLSITKNISGLALHRHCSRDCIYDEMEACRLLGKGNIDKLETQINRYKKNGFPKRFGLFEATMIVTDLKNSNSQKILSKWWEELKISESQRDQISLPYVLWSNGYTVNSIGNLGENLYINPKIRVNKHIR